MTYNERKTLLESAEFRGQVKIALADWLNYWATNGTASIEDEALRQKTNVYITIAHSNLEQYSENLAGLVIGEENIIKAELTRETQSTSNAEIIEMEYTSQPKNTIPDAEVKTAVNHVLATALDYLL